ncbi:MAG TPA: hypothetical protein PLF44_04645 [Candidatus Mcinerneyibacteriales bacterium]|nr:hypothetical protein [Candidatus Mcinerneyibacteriales bacterium]HPJ70150.1 hypothetical protein [Candidatus Mcinerneyibacteriales bacterium]HPQ88955.1 hypothetical protein [Candidatus Mcinerneyibacteriales bacterium]
MHREIEFRDFLEKRPQEKERFEFFVTIADDFSSSVSLEGDPGEKEQALKGYLQEKVAGKDDAFLRLVALVRYLSFVDEKGLITYILTLAGTLGVLEHIKKSAREIAGEEAAGKMFENIGPLPTGTPYEKYPPLIQRFMEQMTQTVDEKTACRIMAGNHHEIPDESKWGERDRFIELGRDIDAFLKDHHKRKVEELDSCRRENKLWYETVITREVVDFVNDNPEVLGGVREGKEIFVTKFPYNAPAYLREKDPLLKRYHACHCGFARSAIIDGTAEIPRLWCACSGGFNKHLFDVIFEQPTTVRVVESVLTGDERCRFAITIPE